MADAAAEKRVRGLRRVVAVQDQLHSAAETRLARVRAEQAAVRVEERETLAALNDDGPLHGLLVDTMARHLRRTAEKLVALGVAENAYEARLREEAGRLKRAERMLNRAEVEHDRETERKGLAELIDAAVARHDASLP